MGASDPDGFLAKPSNVAVACGLAVALLGVVILFAWATGNESLKQVHPGWPTMKANTALGFVLLGSSLVLCARGRERAGQTLAWAAVLLGALTLAQYAFGVDLGIDEALVEDNGSDAGTTAPGRFAILTAMDFILLGLVLVTWRRPTRLAIVMALLGGFAAVFNVAFYLLGAIPPIEGTRMAVHTAVGFLLLSSGLLAVRSGTLADLFLARHATAVTARRLMVPTLLLPLLTGWTAKQLVASDTVAVEQARAFALFANLVVLAILVGLVLLGLRREAGRRKAAEEELARNLRRSEAANAALRAAEAEQQRLRAAAVESEARLRAVLDNASDAIVTGDATATIVGWNRAAERMFGIPAAAALGRPISTLLPPELWAEYEADIAQALQGHPSKYIGHAREMQGLRGDGATIDIELSLALWHSGPAPMFTGVVRDITQRKAAQDAVARATERFERVFHASPVAICLTKDDGTYLDANDAFCSLVGRARDDLLSGRVKAPEVWEDPQERQRMLIAIRDRGIVRDLELRVKRPDGEVRTTLASIEYIDLGGGTTILSLLQDITDRMRMQEEGERRKASEAELDRLRRTDAFRTEFINGIAHELATPLTPLVLKAKTLLADKTLSPTQRAAAETMERNIQRLRGLVDDMVGAADLQARNLALDKRRLNLTRELRAAVAAHHPAAVRAGLAMDDPEDTGLAVSADPARLQLVMGHLLGNAIKFTPPGGRVSVTSRRVGDEVRVEVADTGAGMTRKQMEGLWKPFAQAHDKSQRTDSGSGLGLYVTKGIVELHGGEVGCGSAGPGQGSRFWFTLPLATGHVDPLARPKAEPVDDGPRRNLNP